MSFTLPVFTVLETRGERRCSTHRHEHVSRGLPGWPATARSRPWHLRAEMSAERACGYGREHRCDWRVSSKTSRVPSTPDRPRGPLRKRVVETRQKALGSPSKDAGNDVRRRTTRTDGWTNGRRRRTASDGFTGVPLPSPAENRNPKPELTLGQVRFGQRSRPGTPTCRLMFRGKALAVV